MNFEKLKDIYKYSKTCDITFSRDSLFELIENIESIVRNAQIESEINEAYYQENQKYKEVINKAIKYIEENKQHEYRNGNFNEYYLELNEKEMTELLDILKEVEHDS